MVVNGRIPAMRRAEMVQAFNNDGPHTCSNGQMGWVMLMSSVLYAGTNLARGSRLLELVCPVVFNSS